MQGQSVALSSAGDNIKSLYWLHSYSYWGHWKFYYRCQGKEAQDQITAAIKSLPVSQRKRHLPSNLARFIKFIFLYHWTFWYLFYLPNFSEIASSSTISPSDCLCTLLCLQIALKFQQTINQTNKGTNKPTTEITNKWIKHADFICNCNSSTELSCSQWEVSWQKRVPAANATFCWWSRTKEIILLSFQHTFSSQ